VTNGRYRWTQNLSMVAALALTYAALSGTSLRLPDGALHIAPEQWHSIRTVFVSLFLEALPFMLLGVLVSAALQLFVSEAALARLQPRNPLLGILFACLLGLLLPVCECGMIPIVRRLLRKGMPVYMGITYILAAPIINPVAYLATYSAFRSTPEMALVRTIAGFAAAAAVGWILYLRKSGDPLRGRPADNGSVTNDPSIRPGRKVRLKHEQQHMHLYVHQRQHEHDHAHGPDHRHAYEHRHEHRLQENRGTPASHRFLSFCTHAADEFFEMGKFLMLGAFLTALVQTFVSRSELLELSGGAFGSHLFMMGFAYVISLCSTSDAFVAASFSGVFPGGALIAFLVFGPMIDFKNTLMLLTAFKPRFVLRLVLLVTVVVLAVSLAAGWWLERAA